MNEELLSEGDEIVEVLMRAGVELILYFPVAVNGLPENLAQYTAKIDLRDGGPFGKKVASWVDGSPGLTRNNAAGIITLTFTAAVTRDYSFNIGYLDLLLIGGDGRRSKKVKIILDRGVTK